MIRAVLFDLDDTLLDRESATEVFLEDQYLRLRLREVPFEHYQKRFRELDENGYASRRTVFQSLVKEYRLDVSPDELEAEFRRCVWWNCRLYPDARDTLHRLRRAGYALGIVTNGTSDAQRAKLESSALPESVDAVLVSEEEGLEKPNPEIFLRAAARLRVDPNACLFAGDNPRSDVLGAHSAGMTAVWVRRHMSWPEQLEVQPEHTVSSLSEIVALLRGRRPVV